MTGWLTATIILLLTTLPSGQSMAGERFPLGGEWMLSDAAESESPPGDDAAWHAVDVPAIIPQRHRKPTSVWYRLRFDAPPALVASTEPIALVIDDIRLADETWLNGARIGGEGKFSARWRFDATNPQDLMRVYALPADLLRAQDNRLYIRAKIGFGDGWGAMFPGGAGIVKGEVALAPLASAAADRQKTLIRATLADGVFITLGVIDLLIIVLLLGRSPSPIPEFKWLVLTSLLMLLGSAGHDIFYVLGLDIGGDLLLIIALLGVPPSIALYFQAQHGYLSRQALSTGVVLWLVSASIILLPGFSNNIKLAAWYLYSAIALASFICALLCAIRGVRQKRVAAKIQLLALVVYLFSIRTQWLPDVFFGHRNVQIGSLFYRYALLYAYLARIRRIQLDYRSLSQRVTRIADAVHGNLSREMHDGIGQKLASMKLQLQLAGRDGNGGHLNNIREELDSAITSLRRILAGLHPLHLDRYGLVSAIRQEARHIEKMRGKVKIDTRLEPVTLDKEQELQLFRIFQEAVGNAIHHGRASQITVELSANDRLLSMRLTDNGTGFDVGAKTADRKPGGLGLVSLRERVALLDGELDIKSEAGEGTCVTVSVLL